MSKDKVFTEIKNIENEFEQLIRDDDKVTTNIIIIAFAGVMLFVASI